MALTHIGDVMGSQLIEADNLVRALIIALVRNGTVTEDQLFDAAASLSDGTGGMSAPSAPPHGAIPILRDLSADIARKLHPAGRAQRI